MKSQATATQIRSRAFANSRRLLRDAQQFDEYGLISQAPELEFERLMARTQQVVYSMHEKKHQINHLHRAQVEVFSEVGEARFVDDHTVEFGDGQRLQARKSRLLDRR